MPLNRPELIEEEQREEGQQSEEANDIDMSQLDSADGASAEELEDDAGPEPDDGEQSDADGDEADKRNDGDADGDSDGAISLS